MLKVPNCSAVRFMILVFGVLLLLGNVSCSVVMATQGTKKKDLSVLKEGTPRSIVVAELGAPESTEGNVDVYTYCKGDESSIGRAVGHGVMDVLTLGLWEVVGTPIEAAASSDKECYRIEVVYDENDKLKEIK